MPEFAFVVNEPTPYRLSLLRRLSRELDGVRMHTIFTHTLDKPSMPWRETPGDELNPVHFKDHAIGDGGRFGPRAVRLFRAIRDYITQHRIQLIIIHGYADLTRILLIRWAKRAGIPLLVRGDSNVFSEGRIGWHKRWVKRRFLRWVMGNAAGLMPMGTCGRAFWRIYADHDLPTFTCPVEPDYAALQACTEADRNDFMQRHELDPARHRLMFAGRLVPIKGVDVLIDAFTHIADARPTWDLVIAGDGPQRAALEARVPASLHERVKFLGFLQFADTRACYHACDVLVLPSEYEPWALVVNEAVACGLAVVATDVVGAAAELVRHGVNGLLVAPRQRDALARALQDVTDHDRCAAMRAAAPRILADWRAAGDPVEGVRQALAHVGVAQSMN